MTSKRDEEAKTGRREFLKLAGLGSTAASAALVLGKPAEAAPAAPSADGGYRETTHIRTYYDLARF